MVESLSSGDRALLSKKDRDLFRRAVRDAMTDKAATAAVSQQESRVTGSDRAVFVAAMQDVQPLKVDRVVPVQRRPAPTPLPRRPLRPVDGPRYTGFDFGGHTEVAEQLWFSRSGLQHRILRKLRRGRLTPEAEVDLHGLIVSEAHDAVDALIQEATEHGARCVRIIHGKGNRSLSQMPVLKANVDRWLRCRDEVLAFSSAPPEQGGSGAVLVLLRR